MTEYKGQLIGGKYRVHSVLGEGAMGVVYRAAQLDAEGQPLRDVALKMIQAAFSHDADFAQRFLREVRITARLRNPHAITVYDTGQTDGGQLYYAMEVVEGPTLREVLQRSGPLPVGRVGASPTGATHYLVIGLLGSTDWIHSTHGRKIDKAINMRDKGHPIAIVSEGHWTEHIERTCPLER